jgi:hypothetical protein
MTILRRRVGQHRTILKLIVILFFFGYLSSHAAKQMSDVNVQYKLLYLPAVNLVYRTTVEQYSGNVRKIVCLLNAREPTYSTNMNRSKVVRELNARGRGRRYSEATSPGCPKRVVWATAFPPRSLGDESEH